MATTAASAFTQFLERIRLTDAQDATIASRRESVNGYLKEYFGSSSDMPLLSAKLIGSAARKTIIRPVDDVDVLALFDWTQVWDRYKGDSRAFLYRVRDALSKYSVKVVGARGQAVRLFYTPPPHVDIAPVFRRNPSGFWLPSGEGGWIATDPEFNDDFLSKRNTELSGHLKPVSRMLKQWNRTHGERLRGFHLEVVAQATFSSMGGNYREAFKLFFEYAHRFLRVKDPAGHTDDLSARLTDLQRSLVVQAFDAAKERATKAVAAEAGGDHREAIRLWQIVFGDEFPAYG